MPQYIVNVPFPDTPSKITLIVALEDGVLTIPQIPPSAIEHVTEIMSVKHEVKRIVIGKL